MNLNLFSDDPAKKPESIVDVGCGIGGSSRYLAKKFQAKSVGITLSPVQAQRANALAASQGLADKVIHCHFYFFIALKFSNSFRTPADCHTVDSPINYIIRNMIFMLHYILKISFFNVIFGGFTDYDTLRT